MASSTTLGRCGAGGSGPTTAAAATAATTAAAAAAAALALAAAASIPAPGGGTTDMAGAAAAAGPLPQSRRANLEFPPPPPYPPPHAGPLVSPSCSQQQQQQQSPPGQQTSLAEHPYPLHQHYQRQLHHRALVHAPRDYSYAYYEAGPSSSSSRAHSPTTCAAAAAVSALGLAIGQHPQDYQLLGQPGQSYQTVQAYQLREYRTDPNKRHTYVTRYGTEENIYEEISEISRQCRRALHGSRRSLVAEEQRRVQSCHRKVLGELNLSVEAMLMPTIADQANGDGEDDENDQQAVGNSSTDELLLHHHHHHHHPDELFSTPVGDLDSGFSGSSSASYRSGLGSLRRSLGRTSTPELLSNGCRGHHHQHHYQHHRQQQQHQQQQQQHRNSSGKTKAAMIWKKGWKGWKKLQGLGSGNSQKTGE